MTPSEQCAIDGCRKPAYARGMCCAHYKRHLKTRPHGTARPRQAPAESEPAVLTRMSLPEFLASLAAAVPPLPGASCRNHVELFDRTNGDTRKPDTHEARTAALNLCHDCPALKSCSKWLDSLPTDQRPTGVIASRIITADTTQSSYQREKAARDKRITDLHATGLALSEIAAMTGCSKTTVHRAISGRR